MFCAAVGVNEDAATGSAAGPLACHLCRHGLVEWGEWIEISQGEEIGRPSTLFARADGARRRDRARAVRRPRGHRRARRVPTLGRREELGDRRGRDARGLDRLGAGGALHDVRDGVGVAGAGRIDVSVDRNGGHVLDERRA